MANVNKSARNERKKLLATTLNTLGLAFVVPGVILPLVTLLYGAEMPKASYWLVFALWWTTQAVLLHLSARTVLGRIEE